MSNTIYSNKKSTKKFHYTYQIVELSTNKKYIGVRSSDIEPHLDIGHIYFSSSSDIKFIKRQKEFPNDYEYIVLSIHESREDANKEEMYLHEKYDVASSINFYNKANSSSINFNRVGMAVVRDKDGNIFQVSIDDERYLSGELNGVNKNYVVIRDKSGTIFRVDINDERYKSGDLVHIANGYVSVVDKEGNNIKVSINDPRYLSGDLVHNMVGKKLTNEHKQNISKASSGEKNGFYGKTQSEYCKNSVSNIYEIDGIIYRSRKEVSIKYGVSNKTVANRCNSDRWPTWILVTRRKNSNPIKHINEYLIEGVVYIGQQSAANHYGISGKTVRIRCQSNLEKWSNWIQTK